MIDRKHLQSNELLPIIRTRGLTKVYGSGDIAVRALRGVDVDVDRGEFVAVMGPSGSGKSTLMNILGALDRPSEGRFLLDGRDISELDRAALARVRNEKIGFVFQSFNLLPRTPAIKQVMIPMVYSPAHRHLSSEEKMARAEQALRDVGLGDRLSHKPNELSGGQQQRVAIARALILNPPLILADEPTGNLDTVASHEILGLLDQFHSEGTTIIMVTHEPHIAERAERTLCVQDGRILSDGRDASRSCLERVVMGGVA